MVQIEERRLLCRYSFAKDWLLKAQETLLAFDALETSIRNSTRYTFNSTVAHFYGKPFLSDHPFGRLGNVFLEFADQSLKSVHDETLALYNKLYLQPQALDGDYITVSAKRNGEQWSYSGDVRRHGQKLDLASIAKLCKFQLVRIEREAEILMRSFFPPSEVLHAADYSGEVTRVLQSVFGESVPDACKSLLCKSYLSGAESRAQGSETIASPVRPINHPEAHLQRLKNLLNSEKEETIFYAALEFRYCVEARLLEYAEHADEFTKNKKGVWKVGDLAKHVDGVFNINDNVYSIEIKGERMAAPVLIEYTPITKQVRSLVGQTDNFLHHAGVTQCVRDSKFSQLRRLLGEGAQEMEQCLRGALQGSLVQDSNGVVHMTIAVEKYPELAKAISAGDQVNLHVNVQPYLYKFPLGVQSDTCDQET